MTAPESPPPTGAASGRVLDARHEVDHLLLISVRSGRQYQLSARQESDDHTYQRLEVEPLARDLDGYQHSDQTPH